LRHLLEKMKPTASRATQLLLAACMWTIIGSVLLSFGLSWVIGSHSVWTILLIVIAVVLGVIKALMVLRNTAHRTVARIHQRGPNRCLGGLLSWWSWLLVICMILGGRLLRMSSIPQELLGVIYTAVGIGLVAAATFLWLAWGVERSGVGEKPPI